MIKTSDIIGKPLMSVKEGRQWGRISGFIINTSNFSIEGLVAGNLEKCLPFSRITTFGEQSVLFPDGADLVGCETKAKGFVELSRLKSIRVITESGAELGRIECLYFGKETGLITHYELSESIAGDRKILSQEGVVLIGPDAMIVKDDAAAVADTMRVKNPVRGFIDRLFRTAKRSAGSAADKAKEYSDTAGRQMIEIRKKAADSAHAAAEKTKEAAEDIRKKTGEAADGIKKKAEEAAHTVAEETRKAAEKAKETGEAVRKKASDTADTVRRKTKETADKIKQKVSRKKKEGE